jgi:RNA polymerase sigma factor (sigma-70 family)
MKCLNIATSQLPMDDYELLLDFVQYGKEEAFEQLVSRYANLVYFSALRQVAGESHLAEDIAQVVFTNLAQKAAQLCVDTFARRPVEKELSVNSDQSFEKGKVIAGWLHRDTRFTALEFLRKANRRRMREQEVVAMESIRQDKSQCVWDDVRPLIDEALDQISLQDRNALLLRYFERQSLAEVAEALGTNADAVRKRIDRALEKLRLFLKERGIVTTAAALSVLLIARPPDVIAANLSSTFARAALTSRVRITAAGGPMPAMGVLTLKSAVLILTVILAAGTVGWYGWPHRTSSVPPFRRNDQTPVGLLNGKRVRPGSFVAGVTNDIAFAEALSRLQAVLNATSETMRFPAPGLQEALDGLGSRKKESAPVIREALQNARMPVRVRATFALRLLGKDGSELTPEILNMLKIASMWEARFEAEALAKIAPEHLYGLIDTLNGNPLAREGLAMAVGEIAIRVPKTGASYEIDKRLVDEVAKPLLRDPELKVRITAAYSLASIPSLEPADPAIFPIIIEAMKSKDESIRGLGIYAFQATGRNPFASSNWQVKPGPGFPGLSDVVSALVTAAQESTNEIYRTEAFKLLAISGFDPKVQNQAFQTTYSDYMNTATFMTKVSDSNTGITELADGLKTFPQITVEIAGALGQRGNAAKGAVPALMAALNASEPTLEMGESGQSRARRTRASIVDALAMIVPDQPRPLFSETDLQKIMEVIMEITLRGEEDRTDTLQTALDPILLTVPSFRPGSYAYGYELTPAQMRLVIEAVKASGDPVYAEFIKKVKEVDPHFAF